MTHIISVTQAPNWLIPWRTLLVLLQAALACLSYENHVSLQQTPDIISARIETLVRKTSVAANLFYDQRRLTFRQAKDQEPTNVAPTVSIGSTRNLLIENILQVRVPASIPHYLSYYYFTHQLSRKGACLSNQLSWRVARFGNPPRPLPHPFDPRSHSYIPAWLTFFIATSNRMS